jgi:fructose-specific phosphotransferase system IIB component
MKRLPAWRSGIREGSSRRPWPRSGSAPSASPSQCLHRQRSRPRTRPAPKKIVAITACPTGIAHTFMAAEALKKAAARHGYTIKVETQGSVGARNTLSAEEIAAADVVIIGADTHVDTSRFAGKRVYETSVGRALKETDRVLQEAFALPAPSGAALQRAAEHTEARTPEKPAGAYKHLLTGVSYMLPIVVAGGLVIALSFVFGIEAFKEKGSLAASLMDIGGGAAFALMIPVLAGFIAFSIADRPGLAPGLVGGMLASQLQAGFLGGIVAGFIAGYVARYLRDHIKLPSTFRRPEAGAADSAARHAGGRSADDLCRRQPGTRDHGGAHPLPAGPERHQRGVARPAARRHDGGGYGRTDQQGGLHLRRRPAGEQQFHADGGGYGRRNGAAAGHRARHLPGQEPLLGRRADRRQGRRGARHLVHHRRRDPVRGQGSAARDSCLCRRRGDRPARCR